MEETTTDKYLRKEGESITEHGLRLIEILKMERPNDLEWDDVKRYVNFEGNKDSLRKANDTCFGGYAVHKYYQELLNKNITETTDKDILKEIESKRIELQKERKKLQTSKLEWNKKHPK